jgi:hypothetical protein
VINASLSVDSDHVCDNDGSFGKLKLVYFFLVHYVAPDHRHGIAPDHRHVVGQLSQPLTGLHCILRHAKNLEGLQVTIL